MKQQMKQNKKEFLYSFIYVSLPFADSKAALALGSNSNFR